MKLTKRAVRLAAIIVINTVCYVGVLLYFGYKNSGAYRMNKSRRDKIRFARFYLYIIHKTFKRAGGYGNRAKKKGVYAIYMNGAVEKISKRSSKDIQPGTEIVVPTKQKSKRMTTGEVMAIASGSASLASVVVALISILK